MIVLNFGRTQWHCRIPFIAVCDGLINGISMTRLPDTRGARIRFYPWVSRSAHSMQLQVIGATIPLVFAPGVLILTQWRKPLTLEQEITRMIWYWYWYYLEHKFTFIFIISTLLFLQHNRFNYFTINNLVKKFQTTYLYKLLKNFLQEYK